MTVKAIIFMIIMLGIFWGGFIYLIVVAVKLERNKKRKIILTRKGDN